VIAGIGEADARTQHVLDLVAELTEMGCAAPAMDCEVPDPASGEVLTIAEACWPEGLQPGLGDPVLLELDTQEANLARLRELGYEVFTSAESLLGYVRRRNEQAAGPVSDDAADLGSPAEPIAETQTARQAAASVPVSGSTVDPAVHAAFDRAMRDVYVRAKKEAGYSASFFLTMLSEYGPLGTAHRLLATPAASSGFTALYERGRLDLTVEAIVVQPEFSGLFTEMEVETARQRLDRLGYF
jgi:hypothetical protein